MGDIFKNSYEFQKQQLINVSDASTLNTGFNDISSKLTSLNNSTINNSILDSENQRLTDKNKLIQSMSESQSRSNALNESYRKRNWEFVKLLIVIAISLFAILGISMFLRNIIPDTFIDLLIAIIIGFVIIYSYLTYTTISSRTIIDFDKLNLGNPIPISDTEKTHSEKNISSGASGDLLNAVSSCTGGDCCDSGTKWCSSKNKCLINDANFNTNCPGYSESFSSMTTAGDASAYFDNGYTNYAPYAK